VNDRKEDFIMRILIAEDNLTSRILLKALLEKDGHEVTVTVNGAEAWQALQRPDAPELLVLDWMMPEMDGLEVVRRVRALLTDRPAYIIMLTSMDEKGKVVAALDAGANDYLAKPFDSGELRARVEVGRRMLELQNSLASKNEVLRQALDHIKTLRGIIPICMSCKKIRDDQGYWNQLESYVSKHTEAEFSHGVCPECLDKLYPEFDDDGSGSAT
jgi:CheY-like chemotaxis protein